MACLDNLRVRSVVEQLPWLAPFAKLIPFSPTWDELKRTLPGLRLRLGQDVPLSAGNGLICPVGYMSAERRLPRQVSVLRAGTILRFDQLSHGSEEACAWVGPPTPVFAVVGGPDDGYLVGFYLEWLNAGAPLEAASIEEISAGSKTSQPLPGWERHDV